MRKVGGFLALLNGYIIWRHVVGGILGLVIGVIVATILGMVVTRLFSSPAGDAGVSTGQTDTDTVREPVLKCGGCGSESPAGLRLVHDKKNNRGYLCMSCKAEYERLLKPDSIRNFWMCGACGFRVLAGTHIDAKVDESGNKCPKCGTDVNLSLVNLNKDRAIGRGLIGEPME